MFQYWFRAIYLEKFCQFTWEPVYARCGGCFALVRSSPDLDADLELLNGAYDIILSDGKNPRGIKQIEIFDESGALVHRQRASNNGLLRSTGSIQSSCGHNGGTVYFFPSERD